MSDIWSETSVVRVVSEQDVPMAPLQSLDTISSVCVYWGHRSKVLLSDREHILVF